MEHEKVGKKIYLIRHAESEYNSRLHNLKQLHPGKEEEEILEEIRAIKFHEDTIDCSISDKGIKQTQEVAELLKDKKIAFVITSPLRRCLQTTHHIFSNHPNKPKIIVLPWLKEVTASACDLAHNIHHVKKEFPDFDFSLIDEFETPELWFIETLENELWKEEYYKELNMAYPKQEDAIKNAAIHLALKMKELYPKEIEDPIDFNARIIKVKQWLRKKLAELEKDEELAVVAHSRVLRSFISKEYGPLGEFIGSRRFKNCELAEYEL